MTECANFAILCWRQQKNWSVQLLQQCFAAQTKVLQRRRQLFFVQKALCFLSQVVVAMCSSAILSWPARTRRRCSISTRFFSRLPTSDATAQAAVIWPVPPPLRQCSKGFSGNTLRLQRFVSLMVAFSAASREVTFDRDAFLQVFGVQNGAQHVSSATRRVLNELRAVAGDESVCDM